MKNAMSAMVQVRQWHFLMHWLQGSTSVPFYSHPRPTPFCVFLLSVSRARFQGQTMGVLLSRRDHKLELLRNPKKERTKPTWAKSFGRDQVWTCWAPERCCSRINGEACPPNCNFVFQDIPRWCSGFHSLCDTPRHTNSACAVDSNWGHDRHNTSLLRSCPNG